MHFVLHLPVLFVCSSHIIQLIASACHFSSSFYSKLTVSLFLQDDLITEIMGIEMNTLVDCLVHMVVVEGVVAVLIVIIVEDTTPTTKDVPVQPDGDLL